MISLKTHLSICLGPCKTAKLLLLEVHVQYLCLNVFNIHGPVSNLSASLPLFFLIYCIYENETIEPKT